MARRERRALELAERRKEKKSGKEARAIPPVELLARKRKQYADAWGETAAKLVRDGHYAWMANRLGDSLPPTRRKVLEIGIGTGASTGVLLEKGWNVVGIDENVACLGVAHAIHSGILVLRGLPREAAPGVYSVDYDECTHPGVALAGPGSAKGPADLSRLLLIEGDLAADPGLTRALVDAGPFDAVACWLIDTHDARAQDARIQSIGIRDAAEYRLGMQRLVYLLSDTVLCPGGVLQIVDDVAENRAPPGVSEATAAGLLRLRSGLTRGTSLELLSLDTRGSFVSIRSRREPSTVQGGASSTR
jgi:hypothetical protein